MQPLTFHEDLKMYAHRLTGKFDDDLIQQTYLKAYENLNRFHNTNMRGWLFTIMKNIYINQLAKAVPKHTINTPVDECYSLTTGKDDILSNIYFEEITEIIEDTLTDMAKNTFWLYYEGYNEKEISERLNVKHSTVRSRIFNLRAKLKEFIER